MQQPSPTQQSAPKRPRRKSCNNPTIDTNDSQKRIWSKLFKDEPFPKQPTRRLISHIIKLEDFSDQEQEGADVVEEQQMDPVQQKRLLPHFSIMSDHGEFASRGRSRMEFDCNIGQHRCRSVESHRLPQVEEEKREDDEHQVGRSKLSQFRDHNQFGQHSNRNPETNSPLPTSDSQENRYTVVPERIIEAEAEEARSDKAKQDKSAIASEMKKIFVDEVDQRRRSREEQSDIEEIIEEERQQQETENVKKLRHSLSKLQQENDFLHQFKEKELMLPQSASKEEEEGNEKIKPYLLQETINENHQNQQNHE